eukprot:6292369-Prorocentrum_lima.AAC.1
MMKQQLKEIKESPSSMKGVRAQQEYFQVRREELYLPQAVQEEVATNFAHGFTNPATGLKSTPVTNKEVAKHPGDAMLEWVASIN